ncbi:spore coat protein [Bacillus pseudomycoides]|uniref:Spore coat protein n=1 Tax=Bacillus pseudomycoides TaxID=64104 RepID=A0AA91ZRB4_9BACI|nr:MULTISPECIES: spore coat protein [Bacillus]PEB54295.1 spore coat protein [Bacillus sp. AFS098217]PED80456.1 spore coat protein [Bacillus pseudomycoides]PEU11193.1 spore coat protein [Bacillus sp. AFS014408]PEU13066.1 spore coat protein [Bacillus sp. AFS019443]PFW61959.1 spore coat protein [Bacillus sp. AFS075034]
MNCMEELMSFTYTLIYKIGEYMNRIHDEELKDILQQHLPYMLQAYNEQVNFQEGENLQHMICEQLKSPFIQDDVEMKSIHIGDIGIAISYISHLKRLALNFAQVAVEVANPEFRSFLESCFVKMNRYAYSVWQYVVKKEYKIEDIYINEKFA